jgi:hypothetical protein
MLARRDIFVNYFEGVNMMFYDFKVMGFEVSHILKVFD